ncbi:MAG: acetylornithine deacetylase [Proteobacteria bacterium]|nr:acetylornithine deacetylase [Pseudomonadota bacterium]
MPRAESLEMIAKLVAFDTTSRNSNMQLISHIQAYLSSLGIASTLVPNDDRSKASLYATLGPTDKPGVMLSGHTDVVPVDGQDWTSDPFSVVERDGKLFGRGTSDMKSFIALVLAKLPQFLARGLDTPIHLAFSYDEEVGCVGVRPMIEMINGLPIKPRMAIIGEPTSMRVITGHKGKRSYAAHVRGLEAHSSLAPQGVNAIEFAARLIAYMQGLARTLQTGGPFDELYDVRHTTVHVGTIQGGTALNIVPKDCRFQFEFRYIGGDDPNTLESAIIEYAKKVIEPEMLAIDPSTGFDIKCYNDMPGLDMNVDHEVVTFVKSLAGRNDHGKVAFGTEAGLFQKNGGIPCVVCGPGSIDQAHKPNEFISLEQLDKGEAFLDRLMDRVCNP